MSFHPRGIMQTCRLIWPHFASSRNERAEYGSNLLDRLVKDLKERYGVGFNRSNLQYIRKLYVAFPNCTTLSCNLSWSHYVEILKGDAPLETGFYVILIKSCLCILFPKCAINAAFRKQNNIPYFLRTDYRCNFISMHYLPLFPSKLVYVVIHQCFLYSYCHLKNT